MHVLMATDGSDLSIEAARRGFALLGAPRQVTLLTVLEELPGDDAGGFEGPILTPEEQDALWKAELTVAGDELVRTAAALGCPVETRIEVGHVAGVVCRVAEELGVDVIVVGSHGRTGLKRALLGSTSEHVVRHASMPVLVVHPAHP